MKVSIALCTYNGGKYLKEQLESIATQSHLPDELIIRDDQSKDNTADIIAEFAKTAPFKVDFQVNVLPLGTVKNFERAAEACSGDLVFFCDQDDVWMPTKIVVLVAEMEKNQLDLCFSNATLVDQNMVSLNKNMWDEMRLRTQQRAEWQAGQHLKLMLMGNRVTGCCMAVRREFMLKCMPFPTHINDWIHDGWMALVAATLGTIGMVDQELVRYRQHAQQQIGAKQRDLGQIPTWQDRRNRNRAEKLKPYAERATMWQELLQALRKIAYEHPSYGQILDYVLFLRHRGTLPNSFLERFWPVLLNAGNYFKFKDQDASAKAPLMSLLGDMWE